MPDKLDTVLSSLRRAADDNRSWPVYPTEGMALIAEVERLRAVEADAERARVKADLWSYYKALVQANGAEGITQLVVQRDDARAEVERLRAWVADLRAHDVSLHKAAAAGKAEERAAVVAWLREVLAEASLPLGVSQVFDAVVDTIERGEHRREETP
jgi:cell division protein FtsB